MGFNFNQLKVHIPFKVMVSDVNMHPYIPEGAGGAEDGRDAQPGALIGRQGLTTMP